MIGTQTALRLLAGIVALPGHVAATARTATPQLGWNSYNYYSCLPNETIIQENAQGLVDLGFAEKGYDVVTTDCGWPSSNRTADGKITWNSTLFPSGFPALGEYIHGLGLQFGLYSGAGKWQCTPDPDHIFLVASLGYETEDAQSFAEWGGDALKYDNCWANVTEDKSLIPLQGSLSKLISPARFVEYNPYEPDPSVRFAEMAQALDAVDRPIVYQICQWGVGEDLGVWAPKLGNSWRISNDIYNSWSSIWRITNQVVPFWKHTGVGKYADMDMLIVGLNALSLEEERFHFTMWSINKSPLIIGAPMSTTLTPQASLDILANEEVLAINQDALGQQARLVQRYTEEEYDVWAGNLTDGRLVVAVANWRNDSRSVSLNLSSPALGVAAAGAVRDVWAASDLGAADGGGEALQLDLAGHEAKLLVLSDVTPTNTSLADAHYYPVTGAAVAGGNASILACGGGECLPVGSKAVDVYPGSTVTFSNVSSPSSGGLLLAIDYINYDVALQSSWSNGTNTRNVTLSVNGAAAKRWALPISGGDWFETGRLVVEVGEGFVEGDGNVVVLGAPGPDPAPDVVGLAVLEERSA
ncbi:putative alpha-galactosidase precursor [Diplodia seriata]|uniref:Alpha-galactosidase n=1 Tax=Diplodia seriata TaxID=420778 RepID=A0A0G2E7C0_9PEZI|nr:putative alpha-galactosidase precursor [Diplodia seriata]